MTSTSFSRTPTNSNNATDERNDHRNGDLNQIVVNRNDKDKMRETYFPDGEIIIPDDGDVSYRCF